MEFENQYLKYIEYTRLGGTLSIMPFNILELKARKEIDKYTFGRLINLGEQTLEVKACVYELINILNSYQVSENENKSISSESIDGYSISYKETNAEAYKARKNDIESTISEYLSSCKLPDGTPYLFRG